jgi:hypothetical protein
MRNNITMHNYKKCLDIDIRYIINNSINTEDFKEAVYLVCIQRLSLKYNLVPNLSKVLREKINEIVAEMNEKNGKYNNNINLVRNPLNSTRDTNMERNLDYYEYG